ncbi:MAG: chemotaxis protein CheA [Candidatus Rokuibacteriota bacterium]
MNSDPAPELFFEEAADLLRDFESGLLRLEQRPDDAEVLNRVFRSAHTLKGNSGMLGLEAIARFTHALENLLARLRRAEVRATRTVVDSLLASADVLRELLRRAQAGEAGEAPRFAETLKALEACAQGLAPGGPSTAAPARPMRAPGGRAVYQIRFTPPLDLMRRGLDTVRILDALEGLGDLLRVEPDTGALPALEQMDPEGAYVGFSCWLDTAEPEWRIAECFEFVGGDGTVAIEPISDAAAAGAASDGSPSGGAPEGAAVERRSGRDRRADAEASGASEASSIRVPTEKVDRLVDLVGELVIAQSMIAQLVSDFGPDRLARLAEAVAQMDRHARDLQERVMAIRMLPIRKLFSRFPRMVRDLSRVQGKQVTLETFGEDTELDKGVIEQITDPLTHLVRNAVDHGIELPEVRRRAGKPEVGRLTLRAYQQGGSIHVVVTDDGQGLCRERILAKAVEMGLAAPAEALSDEQVFALVFRPGFSTAARVTEVSGRGVGMDVVKRNLEALGASIAVHSADGQGTTIRAKLPLTLAILDGQSVQVGDATYVLPLVAIVESIQPRLESVHRVFGAGEAVTVRGQVLPLLRLHRLFGITPRAEDPTHGLVVIAEHDGRRVALLVDELLGQQQVVIKSLETNFQKLEGIAGATILGDGRVALILDVPGLVAMSRDVARAAKPAETSARGETDALAGAAR